MMISERAWRATVAYFPDARKSWLKPMRTAARQVDARHFYWACLLAENNGNLYRTSKQSGRSTAGIRYAVDSAHKTWGKALFDKIERLNAPVKMTGLRPLSEDDAAKAISVYTRQLELDRALGYK